MKKFLYSTLLGSLQHKVKALSSNEEIEIVDAISVIVEEYVTSLTGDDCFLYEYALFLWKGHIRVVRADWKSDGKDLAEVDLYKACFREALMHDLFEAFNLSAKEIS